MNSEKISDNTSWDSLLDDKYHKQRFDKKKLDSLKIRPYKNIKIFTIIYDKVFLSLDEKIGKYKRIFLVSLLLFSIIPAITFFISSSIENTLYLPGNNDGFLEDYVDWTHLLVFGLVIFAIKYFYDKTSVFFIEIVNTIKREKCSLADYKKLKDDSEKKFQIRKKSIKDIKLYLILVLGGSILFFMFTFYSQINRSYDIWHSFNYPLGLFFYAILNFITFVIILPIIIYHFFVTVGIIKNFTKTFTEKNALLIRPYNTENAAGFGICGEIALSLYLITLIPIIFIILGILRQIIFTSEKEFAFIVFIPIYIIGLIIIFLYPIITVHKAMKRTKELELQGVRHIYDKNYRQLINFKKSKNLNDETVTLEKLEKLGLVLNDFSNINEWPINLQTARLYITTIIVPIAIFIYQIFFQ